MYLDFANEECTVYRLIGYVARSTFSASIDLLGSFARGSDARRAVVHVTVFRFFWFFSTCYGRKKICVCLMFVFVLSPLRNVHSV